MRAVIADAILEWNKLACNTGIIFIAENSGVFADIDFFQLSTDSSALTGGCIAYRPIDIVSGLQAYDISYGPNFMQRLSQLGHNEARAAVMHELGHVLGLDHTNPPNWTATIMTQPASCSANAPVTSLTTADGNKVAQCLNTAPNCQWIFIFFPIPILCEQQGGYWNFTIGVCSPFPEPTPCVDCVDNGDCCNGDVCHNGVCGPPEIYCPPCPPDTVCVEGLCSYCTPILIDVAGDGFRLTGAAGGVDFNFGGDGVRRRLPWTAGGTDDAWLVLDRNRNGQIDTGLEMFGNVTPQTTSPQQDRNGFIALAEFDKPDSGGNGDGEISRHDFIFRYLQLWTDSNHNGISEATELSSLDQMGVDVLELDYRLSSRSDRYGNLFRYRAKVKNANGAQLGRWAWDVIFNGRGR